MSMEEMIMEEIKRQFKTIKGFSETVGIPYTTIRNALEKEGRLMKSGLGNAIIIFEALGLDIIKTFEEGTLQKAEITKTKPSVDYLTETNAIEESATYSTDFYERFSAYFNILNDSGQQKLIEYAQDLLEIDKYKK